MYKCCEIITRSLIDFEEMKYILANENADLTNSYIIKENIFIKDNISLTNSNYDTILKNSIRLININEKLYLANIKYLDNNIKLISQMEVINEEDCKDFLLQCEYKNGFTLEQDAYVFSNNEAKIIIFNLINIGWYVCVSKKDSTKEELIDILNSFNIPYDETCLDINLEKLVINKIRRQSK